MGQKVPLWAQIVIGLVLGIVAGWLLRFEALSSAQSTVLGVFDVGAEIFLRMLKMCVVPLVVSSLFIGITNISNIKSLGKLGTKTGIYYIFSSLIAIGVGLLFVNLFKPGKGSSLQLG